MVSKPISGNFLPIEALYFRFCFPSPLLSSGVLCQLIHHTKSGIINRKCMILCNEM